ncbi:hypothetical protein D3C72_1893320 [compost metagenome]
MRIRYCFQGAAEVFRQIARVVEGNADEQRRVGAQMDAEIAEAEMSHVDLEQRGRVARDLDPGGGKTAEGAVAGQAEPCQCQRAYDADEHGQQRDLQRDQRTVEHLRQCFQRLVPVEGVIEHRRLTFSKMSDTNMR